MSEKEIKKIFYTEDEGNVFHIRFDEIFKNERLDVFNDFELKSRRTFKNLADTILETYEELFIDGDGSFREEMAVVMFNLLNVKSELDYISARSEPQTEEDVKLLSDRDREKFENGTWNSTTYEEFIEMLDSFVGNISINSRGELLKKVPVTFDIDEEADSVLLVNINDHIEKHYSLGLDESTQEAKDMNKKINEELQFTDRHAKTLIKTAYLFRIAIPIISTYFTLNKDQFPKDIDEANEPGYEDMEFNDIFISIFVHLFEKYSGKRANALKNKLFKLILSRISRTTYSDRRFWMLAKNQGITKDTVALDIYKKLLTNAVPKLSLDPELNAVSFLLVVAGNQIDFLFQDKFKHKIMTLNGTGEKYSDQDDVSEYERLELTMLKADEGQYILRKLSIDQVLNKLPEYMNVEITEEEILKMQPHLEKHHIQNNIVSLLTYKYFGDKMSVKFMDFQQYTRLVLIVHKFLKSVKLGFLADVIISKEYKLKQREGIVGSRIRPWIEGSSKYKKLFNEKFELFGKDLERPVGAMIATIYSSEYLNREGVSVLDSNKKVDDVADEILDLMWLV